MVAVLAAGCASATPGTHPAKLEQVTIPAPESEPAKEAERAQPDDGEVLHGFGVIRTSAEFYSRASSTSAMERRESDDSAEDARQPGEPRVVRVLRARKSTTAGTTEEFIEVELDGTASFADHCEKLLAVPGAKLTLFVRKEDLVPLTTKKVERSFDDGTSYQLLPGLALILGERTEDGWQATVHTENVILTVSVPEAAVGKFFEPTDANDPIDADELDVKIPKSGHLELGDGSTVRFDTPWSVIGAKRRQHDASGSLVELVRDCVRVVGRTTAEPSEPDAREFGMIGLLNTGGTPPVVEAGTTIQWVDGARAGIVVDELRLDSSDFASLSAADDPLPCYRHRDSQLTLCFPATAIRSSPP